MADRSVGESYQCERCGQFVPLGVWLDRGEGIYEQNDSEQGTKQMVIILDDHQFIQVCPDCLLPLKAEQAGQPQFNIASINPLTGVWSDGQHSVPLELQS